MSGTIKAGGISGDPPIRAVVNLFVNPTGSLEPNDRLWLRIYSNAALSKSITVRGDTVAAAFNLSVELMVNPLSESRIEISMNTGQSNEKWGIFDEGISLTFPPAPLPVELISFRGDLKYGKVSLGWITRAEINNDYFTVERSQDGINSSQAAKIKRQRNHHHPFALCLFRNLY